MNTNKLTAYVGTYTNGESKGIYRFTMDASSGKIEDVSLAGEMENPTYLAIDKNNKLLYSVAKVGDGGGVAAFKIKNSGDLELINYQVSQGKPPCYVGLNSKNEYVFSANYHRATIEVFPVREDGGIDIPSSVITHEGSGPNKERQEKAHAHYAALTPDEKYLCAVDLGIDKLAVYSLNRGSLSEANGLSLSLRPGCGPRHLAFHPNGKFAYIITELSSEIVALEYSPSDGFKEIQYISALPEGFNGENLGSAIYVSPDGRYLYASNRGHNSIAIFRIDITSGRLEVVGHESTGGEHPRDFAIDPTGKFLIAANQDTNNIVPFSIDNSTGKLTRIGDSISIPNPVCIKFINI
ncbi:lactonase family protein [Fonticella tunisiensis]|uniref:6-phosphogluconolactonase n=1 Tax=Fonticella tunisiensis TaxID=1096341 RepID=A0A4R7KWJ3_9CLOT|nr:lactonase family protein [Fonticella tunisiensis]TDT63266.1 6-phosphogluconolactonase [Fonticella tunisiensis]